MAATQKLLFLQSLWAMERRHSDGKERTLEQNIEMILGADFDGVSMSFTDAAAARRGCALEAARQGNRGAVFSRHG